MHDLYCVRKAQDPKFNPGHIPCPDYELRNCEGCILMEEIEREKAYKKQLLLH